MINLYLRIAESKTETSARGARGVSTDVSTRNSCWPEDRGGVIMDRPHLVDSGPALRIRLAPRHALRAKI
jgi:hypothetical protein